MQQSQNSLWMRWRGSPSIHLTVASNSDLHFPIVVDHKQFRFLSRFVQSLKWNRHSLSLDMELESQHPSPEQMHSLFTQKTVWKIDQTVKRCRWCFHKHVLVYCLALKWEFLTRLLLKSDTGSSRNLKKRKGRHVTRSRFGARLWSPLFWSQIIKEQTSEQPCFFFKFLGGRLEDRKTHMHSDVSHIETRCLMLQAFKIKMNVRLVVSDVVHWAAESSLHPNPAISTWQQH